MGIVTTDSEHYTNIANAIRAKLEVDDSVKFKPSEMADAINSINGTVFIASETAPENLEIFWVDTSNGGALRYYDTDSSTWKFIPGVYGGE